MCFLEILKIQLDGRKQPGAIYINEYFSRCLLMHKNTQKKIGRVSDRITSCTFFLKHHLKMRFLTNRNFLSTWPEAAGDYIP